jgi:hypothetical protein
VKTIEYRMACDRCDATATFVAEPPLVTWSEVTIRTSTGTRVVHLCGACGRWLREVTAHDEAARGLP